MSECPGKGAEIEMVIKALYTQGIRLHKDFEIECVSDFEEIEYRIKTEDAVAFGGIRPSKLMTLNGIQFTHPTYYSGLNILIKKIDVNDPMKLFKVFTFQVWILFCLSPLIVGICSWVYHSILDRTQFKFNQLLTFTWDAYSAMMFYSSPVNKTARIEEMSLSIYMRIFFIILSAAYASDTYQKLINFIQKFGDLAGQLVLVEPQYEDLCGQFAILYYSFKHHFYEDFDKAVDLLESGKYWGIIADHTFLVEQLKKYSGVTINTYPFLVFSYAGIYSNLSQELSIKINQALSSIQATNIPVVIQENYELIQDFKSTTQETLAFEDVIWLFFAIAFVCVIGLVLSFIPVQGFYSENWDFCCRRHSRLFEELDITSRVDSNNSNRKLSGVGFETIESSWASDLNQEFVRLIKICTLSIIEYENKSFAAIDVLSNRLKEANAERVEIIEKVEKFYQE
jgi:hypothetical protein